VVVVEAMRVAEAHYGLSGFLRLLSLKSHLRVRLRLLLQSGPRQASRGRELIPDLVFVCLIPVLAFVSLARFLGRVYLPPA